MLATPSIGAGHPLAPADAGTATSFHAFANGDEAGLVSDSEDDIVVTQDGRLKGCRGRVLVAVLVVTVLLILLVVSLFYGMMSGPAPQPVRRAAADTVPELAITRIEAVGRRRQWHEADTGFRRS